MVTRPTTRLAFVFGVLTLTLTMTVGAGRAFADPLDPAINTTCSYPQAVAALNAASPAVTQQFNASRAAQAWVRAFFSSPVDQRRRMAVQAQSVPGAQDYVGLILQIANTCNDY